MQSFDPDHPVLRALAAGDRDGFIAGEAEARRAAGMPPFGRLAAIIVSGPDEAGVEDLCRRLARSAPRDPAIEVLGPVPAPLALLRGRHRRRFLIKSPRALPLQATLRAWLADCPAAGPLRIQVDIDPYGFL
jgi:primosomal protein N' (replication factor Y)